MEFLENIQEEKILMHHENSHIDRLNKIIQKTAQLQTVGDESKEIMQNIINIHNLMADQHSIKEPGGNANHPLGWAPHLTTKILYYLDRCEVLLRNMEDCDGEPRKNIIDPEHLLYPTISETILRRIFSVLLYIRGRILKYSVDYDHPTFREILYLKSPIWLEPFIRQILPKRRWRWSYSLKRICRERNQRDKHIF
jgi:hypothetical protein